MTHVAPLADATPVPDTDTEAAPIDDADLITPAAAAEVRA
jgi:hypothetical protein